MSAYLTAAERVIIHPMVVSGTSFALFWECLARRRVDLADGGTTIEAGDFVTIHSRSGISEETLSAFTGQ